jgi:hypothetical protein
MMKASGKRQNGGESVSGYFRKIFLKRPELLDSTSNEELLSQWKTDHGATEVPASVRSNLANLKSNLRKRVREGRPLSAKATVPAAAAPVRRSSNHGLAALEEHIDDSLSMAKTLDRTGLDEVIHLLRLARNKVVWKMGE